MQESRISERGNQAIANAARRAVSPKTGRASSRYASKCARKNATRLAISHSLALACEWMSPVRIRSAVKTKLEVRSKASWEVNCDMNQNPSERMSHFTPVFAIVASGPSLNWRQMASTQSRTQGVGTAAHLLSLGRSASDRWLKMERTRAETSKPAPTITHPTVEYL